MVVSSDGLTSNKLSLNVLGVTYSLYSWLKDLSDIHKSPDMSIATYSIKFKEVLDVLIVSGLTMHW
jgi:hypothetical protein